MESLCSCRLEFTGVGSASRNRTAAPTFSLLPSQNKQHRKVIFPFSSGCCQGLSEPRVTRVGLDSIQGSETQQRLATVLKQKDNVGNMD